jgi:hypothetical protein
VDANPVIVASVCSWYILPYIVNFNQRKLMGKSLWVLPA